MPTNMTKISPRRNVVTSRVKDFFNTMDVRRTKRDKIEYIENNKCDKRLQKISSKLYFNLFI